MHHSSLKMRNFGKTEEQAHPEGQKYYYEIFCHKMHHSKHTEKKHIFLMLKKTHRNLSQNTPRHLTSDGTKKHTEKHTPKFVTPKFMHHAPFGSFYGRGDEHTIKLLKANNQRHVSSRREAKLLVTALRYHTILY